MSSRNKNVGGAEERAHNSKGRKLANASLVVAILGLLYASIAVPGNAYSVETVVGIVLCLFGFVLGCVALVKMKRAKGKLGECWAAILAIAICAVLFVALLNAYSSSKNMRKRAYEVRCAANLSGLGREMLVYANDYSQYPVPDKWCDLLIEHTEVTEISFVCRGAGDGRCHYAMNPNCGPNSPPDVVLLFETKGGWNQFGGQEILTLENHRGGGCSVLFNDGHVKFVWAKRIGELKWE